MKALVLGGSGFIGSHVVRALLHTEVQVRVLTRSPEIPLGLKGLDVEWVRGDLANLNSLISAMKGVQALFHVAGYYPLYSLNRKSQTELATQQMKNVLTAAGNTPGVEKIVYTSSLSTIGIPEQGLANEQTPYHPEQMDGLYYEIKYRLEQMALQAAREGLPLTVVNPTAVFGDYDIKPTSGIFILKVARQNLPFYIDAKINAVDAIDVAHAQVSAWQQGRIGERYILGGYNMTVGEMTHLIARLAKVMAPKVKLPLVFGQVAARLSEMTDRYLFHKDKPTLPMVGIDFLRHGCHFDSSKAKQELGLTSYPLEETIERSIEWFKKNGYL